MSAKVSVVIPTYNRAGYLPEAIDSVLEQTIDDLVEVIVVDDGSTDRTPDIVRSYGDRIKYIRTVNHGTPAHARNVGMRLATGAYVAFLDSDDAIYPYKLELQSTLLDRYEDIGMTYSECSAMDDCGVTEQFHLRHYHPSAYRVPGRTYEAMFEESIELGRSQLMQPAIAGCEGYADRRAYFGNIFSTYLYDLVVFTNSMMVRRSVLDAVGYQNETLTFFEEADFALRICRRYRVAFIDVPTYKLRYHPRQISATTGPAGAWVSIHKQHCLLRTVRQHVRGDLEYYAQNRTELDKHLARLHRAVAVPLLAYGRGPRSVRSDYPRRARRFLSRCRSLGRPEPFLWCASFMPPGLRRIAFAVQSRSQKLRRRLRTNQTTRARVRAPGTTQDVQQPASARPGSR